MAEIKQNLYLIKIYFHVILYRCSAGIAQSVEQLIRNQQVKGSSPFASSGFQDFKIKKVLKKCLKNKSVKGTNAKIRGIH